MKKLGMFVSGGDGWTVRQLEKQAEKKGISCELFLLNEVVSRIDGEPKFSCRGKDLENFDALIVRWVPDGSGEQLIFRMNVLHILENLGVKILNPPSAIEKCTDKFYASSLLEDEGLPVPETVVAEGRDVAENAFEEFGDIIVKPLFGSSGTGMVRVDNEDLADRVFRALEFGRYVYYVQEFLQHENRDKRVFVLNGKVLASMERVGEDWRTNCARKGIARSCDVSNELEELSLKAARVLDCDYAGVDFIESDDELYVVEVNAIPGWENLQSVTDTNIAEEIIDYLMEI